ncbi:IC domain protein, HAD ATPase, P-type family [Lentilactobacillus kisonensis F0435]|nr:IC domain protein, HAD ATPase, P-type family [Lentilactobacillus kisonensis F0435]
MILTGDYHQSTEQIIQQTGLSGKVITGKELDHLKSIDGITAISEVLPENKLAAVKKCQELGFTVGMIGDGINDAPALKLANIGIATANATDIAKQAAKLILMKDSLLSITNIIDSGHRVYQRMMTWTITKLVRTAELTILLTLGYLFFRFIPLSLNALVLIAILNDLVTMVLGTDNTQITYHPEKWGFKKIINQASVLTIGWTVVALAILVMLVQHLPASKISSILFLFLIASAMLTILMTRTTKLFWLGRPSSAVLTATSANLAIAILASTFGWGIAIISFSSIGITILATVVASLVLNVIQRFSWN